MRTFVLAVLTGCSFIGARAPDPTVPRRLECPGWPQTVDALMTVAMLPLGTWITVAEIGKPEPPGPAFYVEGLPMLVVGGVFGGSLAYGMYSHSRCRRLRSVWNV